MRAHLRELPFGEVGMARVERVRDGELEHAVAEELEPLVRLGPVGRPRSMGERDRLPVGRERVDQRREVLMSGLVTYWCDET